MISQVEIIIREAGKRYNTNGMKNLFCLTGCYNGLVFSNTRFLLNITITVYTQ